MAFEFSCVIRGNLHFKAAIRTAFLHLVGLLVNPTARKSHGGGDTQTRPATLRRRSSPLITRRHSFMLCSRTLHSRRCEVRHETAHHTHFPASRLSFRGGDLVADALADHLALELREGQQNVEEGFGREKPTPRARRWRPIAPPSLSAPPAGIYRSRRSRPQSAVRLKITAMPTAKSLGIEPAARPCNLR